MTVEGATDTAVFQANVCAFLVHTLRPGDIVVMDNLGSHKNKQTVALIEHAGSTVRFLPAYSSDLNPIEMGSSKIKALVRAAEARSPDELQHALRSVTPTDTAHWFAACGFSII